MKTIFLVLALIQVTVALECVEAFKDSPQLDGSERSSTCLCGDYCVSYYFQPDNKYVWSCGCFIPKSGAPINLCGHEGINIFGKVRHHCCSGDMCNNKNQTNNDENTLIRSFVKTVEHLAQ